MKYDLHMHTKFSRDSRNEPRDIIKAAIKAGLDGIAVTDHNTIKGGQECLKLAKDIDVIPGVEVKTNIGDVLCYYVNEEIKSRELLSVIDEVKSMDGIISVAHPYTRGVFRRACTLNLEKAPKGIDAIECFNGRMFLQSGNERAAAIAKKTNRAMTAGSDAHFISEIGRAYAEFDGDFRKAIAKRKISVQGTLRNSLFYRVWTLKNLL